MATTMTAKMETGASLSRATGNVKASASLRLSCYSPAPVPAQVMARCAVHLHPSGLSGRGERRASPTGNWDAGSSKAQASLRACGMQALDQSS